MKPFTADEANFAAEVVESPQPVLVAFSAEWSRPCLILEPVLDEIASSCSEKLKVVRVNADANPYLSLCYDVQSVPTLLYFVGGGVRCRIVGTATKEAILSKLNPSSTLTPVPEGGGIVEHTNE
jgi:thioredoxin 1